MSPKILTCRHAVLQVDGFLRNITTDSTSLKPAEGEQIVEVVYLESPNPYSEESAPQYKYNAEIKRATLAVSE